MRTAHSIWWEIPIPGDLSLVRSFSTSSRESAGMESWSLDNSSTYLGNSGNPRKIMEKWREIIESIRNVQEIMDRNDRNTHEKWDLAWLGLSPKNMDDATGHCSLQNVVWITPIFSYRHVRSRRATCPKMWQWICTLIAGVEIPYWTRKFLREISGCFRVGVGPESCEISKRSVNVCRFWEVSLSSWTHDTS